MRALHRRLSGVATFLATAGGAAPACNIIVGAGDYSVGNDASTHGGRSDAGGHLGDPCATNAQCTEGTCNGRWCTKACTTNSACGMSGSGQSNYCVQNANNEFVCVPGCTGDPDCQAFPSATCRPIPGVAESVCTVSSTGVDGGSSGISVGDPCTVTGSSCGQGADHCNGSWCVAACTSPTDTSCGNNSLGVSNYCVSNDQSTFICFPGCSSNADCTPISGTTCQPVGSSTTESICAGTLGDIGDPCSTATPSPWTACIQGTCVGAWCNETCASSTDTSCGTNTASTTNHCVQNSGNAFSCFPGCTTDSDCASYGSTFCQPDAAGAGFVCAKSGGQVGDPCNSNSDCKQTGATCVGSWCGLPCTSPTDTICGTNSAGTTNYCVQDTTTHNFTCFPGCSTDLDCVPYPGSPSATCSSTGTGTQSVCGF